MRQFNLPLGPSSMALVTDDPTALDRLKAAISRLRRKARSFFCVTLHGGHELYRARTDTRLFQQCLLCGHETQGWTIDRRDRRLHLVSNHEQTCLSRANQR